MFKTTVYFSSSGCNLMVEPISSNTKRQQPQMVTPLRETWLSLSYFYFLCHISSSSQSSLVRICMHGSQNQNVQSTKVCTIMLTLYMHMYIWERYKQCLICLATISNNFSKKCSSMLFQSMLRSKTVER